MPSRLFSPAVLPTVLAAGCLLLPAGAGAQATGAGVEHPDSRTEIYGGYGYFHPVNSGIDGFQYQDVSNPNATVSFTGFFNRYIGIQIEAGYFSGENEHKPYFPTCTGTECD